ncbi:EamA family transporter [Sandarakinorhabdus sp.]|uniref:DMT family transporter n=1 Tax=Sandarakinorhabdus sp. TaxID=1916663 RepID=UPI00286D7767|nr:EamA family transporter [Sandarakinorhabdus sp.]
MSGNSGLSPRGWAAFIGCTLIWGSTWLVIKTQLGVVPPSWSVTWRFLLGGLVMTALCLARGRSLALSPRQHGFALLIAVMQFVLNFNLVYRAEQSLTSGLVSLSFALLLVPNTLLAAAFLGQKVTLRFVLGSLIGIAGVSLLFAHDFFMPGASAGVIATGLGLAMGGVMCASIANVLQGSSAGRNQPLEAGLAWSMLYGAGINAVVATAVSGPPVFDASPGYVAGLAYLGIVASAVAFSLYYMLIKEMGPGRAAYNGVVVPVVAMGLSTVFESYQWTPLAALGAVLALSGLVIALRGKSPA